MSADLRMVLAEMRERVEGATAGPWNRHDFGYAGEQEPSSIVVHTGKFDHAAIREGETVIAGMQWDAQEDANATFIAHARTDLPALLDAVEAVLGLHESVQDGSRCICQPAWRGHPCPTVRAITDALGGA